MRQKYIDTHVHLLLSKKQVEPHWESIRDMCEIAMQSGIDGLCVTEHIESVGYVKLMTDLFINNVLQGELSENGLIIENKLVLYPAAEVQLCNGSNIGVHAKIESLLALNKDAGFYDLDSLRAALDAQDNEYALVAHHILWPGKEYPNMDELTRKVNAIEVPAKDIEKMASYKDLAVMYGKPVTGGSDSHTPIQIGASYTVFDEVESELHHINLIRSIKSSRCNNVVHPFARRLVNMAKIYRKNLSQSA